MEEKLFDSEFFSKLNTMKMITRMRLNGGMSGQRKSSAKGNSVEFSDFREYIPGDDIRRIDWNVYGRMDKLFIKEFMEEKEGLFHVIIDCSKSMDFGAKNKSVQARRIAAMISYMVLNNLDRVCLTSLHGETSVTTKGMTGRQAFSKVLSELERMEFWGETSLCKAVKKLPLKQKGVVILISDFLRSEEDSSKKTVEKGTVFEQIGRRKVMDRLGTTQNVSEEKQKGDYLEELIRYLRFHKQEVILVQVLSNEEENPLGEGTLELLDIENENRMKVTMTNAALKEYDHSLKELKSNIERICKKYQAGYIPVTTEEALETVMYKGIQAGYFAGR